MILVIDNYDSFAYNLVQRLGELGYDSSVYRNDKVTLAEIEAQHPSHIVISPGPCTPLEAGISNDVVSYFGGKIPILGVCLGHQCIGYVFNGIVSRALVPVHGKASLVYHDGQTIYQNIANPFIAGRYHSLVVRKEKFPSCLKLTARTEEGEIMGIRHREYVIEGTQIHPESILTDVGYDLLSNFLRYNTPFWPEPENHISSPIAGEN